MSTIHIGNGNDVHYSFDGSNAVDGIYTPPVVAGAEDVSSLTHTEEEQSPWLQINLGQRRCIKGVKIWNRTYCRFNFIFSLSADFSIFCSIYWTFGYRYASEIILQNNGDD